MLARRLYLISCLYVIVRLCIFASVIQICCLHCVVVETIVVAVVDDIVCVVLVVVVHVFVLALGFVRDIVFVRLLSIIILLLLLLLFRLGWLLLV